MVIQHFVPGHTDKCPKCIIYYENVLVWICGSFVLLAFLTILSLIPVHIGRRRRQRNSDEYIDDRTILPDNMEVESDEGA